MGGKGEFPHESIATEERVFEEYHLVSQGSSSGFLRNEGGLEEAPTGSNTTELNGVRPAANSGISRVDLRNMTGPVYIL